MKHWKSIVALTLIPFAFYFNIIEFYFAILFLVWSIQGLKNKSVFLLDHIAQNENPILYWLITITWFALALLSLAYSEPIITYFS